MNAIRTGAVVTGTVIGVKENEISLNIGYKSDGIITKSEYSSDPAVDLTEAVHVGDEMQVKVLKINDGDGRVSLSYRRLEQERASKAMQEAMDNQSVLTGKVTSTVPAGLSVDVDGFRVFIPASLVSERFERDLTKYQDKEIEFYLEEFNPRKRRIIGNRRKLLAERKEASEKALLESLEVGMIVNGKIKNMTDFGAFVDLGGGDGLLHITEMTWGRPESPKKLFKVGQEVEAFVKSIKGNRISLSMKFPDQNPWLNADEKYAVGNIVTGKVARMTDFGAFVSLAPGVDALLHVSQILSTGRVNKPSDVLSIGQEIRAKVLDFNGEDKKISISMKALENDEAAAGETLTAPIKVDIPAAPVAEETAEPAPAVTEE